MCQRNPEFAARVPDQALVVMLLAEDAEFSQWNRQNAQRMAEKNNRSFFFILRKKLLKLIKEKKPQISQITLIFICEIGDPVPLSGIGMWLIFFCLNFEIPMQQIKFGQRSRKQLL